MPLAFLMLMIASSLGMFQITTAFVPDWITLEVDGGPNYGGM